MLQSNGNAVDITRIATWDVNSDAFDVLTTVEQREALAVWAGLTVEELDTELEGREQFLQTLMRTGVSAIPEVNAAIEEYYATVGAQRTPQSD